MTAVITVARGEPPITKQAYHVSAGSNLPVNRLVVHDEEYPVSIHSAEDIANYFAGSSSGGSAQYVFDQDSEQHCVHDGAIAWHAPPNAHSIGGEMDGYSRFTSADWQTPGSQGSLRRCAARFAELCLRFSIPIRWLEVADLKANPSVKGITSHNNVSLAFRQSDHTDPGTQFPIAQFLGYVTEAYNAMTGTPVPAPPPPGPIVGDMICPTGGYALIGPDGGVFNYDGSPFCGTPGDAGVHRTDFTSGCYTLTGKGYWLQTIDGAIFSFGDAVYQDAYNAHPELHGGGPRTFHVIVPNRKSILACGGYDQADDVREIYSWARRS